ncbi:response regulator [Cupriavidus sp. RAF12]|uniref:response regulator n=1 Tax=Cupriavidus sp. RAF12 TaxID=3233050 RepID=UPI003F8E1BCC
MPKTIRSACWSWKTSLRASGGCHVDTCQTGVAAWQSLQREPAALLLTDVGLPGMDGLELARAVRAREAREDIKRLPIVVITATAGPEERLACLMAGADMVLSKPVSFEALRAVVRRHLSTCDQPLILRLP